MYKPDLDIINLQKSEDLALLLGLFAGDGCLSVKHNGDGNRVYPITFYNTNKNYVLLFAKLFEDLFGISGSVRERTRDGKLPLWEFEKYSVLLYKIINTDFEICSGRKALNVRIPSFIRSGSMGQQMNFILGLLATDGSVRSEGSILFHCASKQLLEDLNLIVFNRFGFKRMVRRYLQNQRYYSYQLALNKPQSSILLNKLPSSHNLRLRL